MTRLAIRELLSRRVSSALAALGLLTATLGFIVLVSTSRTTEATLTGDIGQAWITPYDILVRPKGATTPLEASDGLVRPNFLSATDGGISLAQLRAIRAIPAVQVAAPVAVAGIFYETAYLRLDLRSLVGAGDLVAFRVSATRIADAGLSSFPASIRYVLVAPHGALELGAADRVTLVTSTRRVDCSALSTPTAPVQCFAPTSYCVQGTSPCPNGIFTNPVAEVPFTQPVVVAGIDPVAEAQLAGLDRCTTSGHFFTGKDVVQSDRGGQTMSVPVLASSTTFVDETLHTVVSRTGSPSLVNPLGDIRGWLPVLDTRASAQTVYAGATRSGVADLGSMWTPGDVAYRGSGDRLSAVARDPDMRAFAGTSQNPGDSSQLSIDVRTVFIPPDVQDSWFRGVTTHALLTGSDEDHRTSPPDIHVIGHYDPDCLAGFTPLAGGRLEAYAPARVDLPGGRQLRPNASLAGYVNLPPTILTSLDGILAFDNPAAYAGVPHDAPISAIRVRVAGTQTPSGPAEAQLGRVAAAISDATGLQVDVVKGASPRSISVDLPAGRFGRPALTVTEPWSVKGVGYRFFSAVSTQNLAIFAVVLVGAAVLVGQTAYTAVRRRRRELGVLRALGWPTWRLGLLVEVEMTLLGVATGALAVGLGIPLARALGLGLAAWQVAALVPISVGLAALAAAPPAMTVGCGLAVTVVAGAGRVSRARPPSSAVSVGIRELRTTWRAEAALGASAIALGATMLGVIVVVATGFSRELDPTRLGVDLASRVHPFHVVLAIVTATIGAVSVAEIVTLSYLESRPHLGVLRALGWPRIRVVALVAGQALVLGALGGLVATGLTTLVSVLLGAGPGPTIAGAAAALGMAVISTAVAAAGPLLYAYSSDPARALRGE